MASALFEVTVDQQEGVTISAPRGKLKEFSSALENFASTAKDGLRLQQQFDVVRFFSGAENLIGVDEVGVFLAGTSEFFQNLSCNVPWDAEDPKLPVEYHVHYDKISFDWLLSENSLDLIIYKQRDAN